MRVGTTGGRRPADSADEARRARDDAFRPGLEITLLSATESAALAVARLAGRGDQDKVKRVAAAAMLEALDERLAVRARIVLAPGGDPILSPGSVLGQGDDVQVDLGVYPIEAAGLVARGLPNALSLIVATPSESFPLLPGVAYIEKLVVGPAARGGIVLDDSLADNLRRLAFARDCRVADLVVGVLDRPRHQELMEEIRSIGARLQVIPDGDVGTAITAAIDGTGLDAMAGTGGLQEAVMSACAMRCLGGDLQARLWPRNDEELAAVGADAGRIYDVASLAPDPVVMAVTGVTGGTLLGPVRYRGAWSDTESLVMASRYSTVRRVTTRHQRPSPELGEGVD